MNGGDTGLAPLAAGDDWWAVFRRGEPAVDVRSGRYGDGPAQLLGMRRVGADWHCEARETRELVARVFANGDPIGVTRTLEDPRCGPRPLEFAFAPLAGAHDVTGVVVRCRELTARRAHVAALQLQAQVLEAMSEGVLLLGADGSIDLVNPAGEALLGYPPGQLAGRSAAELGPGFAAGVQAAASADSDRLTTPLEIRQPGGAVLWLRVIVRALPGASERRLVVLHDVTGQLRLERELLDAERHERERLARDLHDGVGQELTGIALLLRGIASSLRPAQPAASAELEQVVALVNGLIGGTRSMARGLFEPRLPPDGLAGALAALAARGGGDAGPSVRFTPHLGVPLGLEPRAAVELYRIAQEATTNALRHSGARHIEIGLESTAAAVALTIDDDGRGLPADVAGHHGMGLNIMRYRAHALGTELHVGAGTGRGTRIAVAVQRGTAG